MLKEFPGFHVIRLTRGRGSLTFSTRSIRVLLFVRYDVTVQVTNSPSDGMWASDCVVGGHLDRDGATQHTHTHKLKKWKSKNKPANTIKGTTIISVLRKAKSTCGLPGFSISVRGPLDPGG